MELTARSHVVHHVRMSPLRALAACVLAVSGLAVAAAPMLASCLGPVSIQDYAARADAVVYGEVVGFEGPPGGPPSRFAIFHVQRVLRGSATATIGVGIGPEAEGGPGTGPVATSVDYQVRVSTDHTLYLRRQGPSGFSTDACSGSHPGRPTPEEDAFFGKGTEPDREPTGLGGATDLDRGIAALAVVTALAAGIGAIVYAMRSARPSPA